MKSKIPDNVVFSEENGYNANVLAYPYGNSIVLLGYS